MNLYGEFECALHMFICMASIFISIYMLVWCMLVVGLNVEMKN